MAAAGLRPPYFPPETPRSRPRRNAPVRCYSGARNSTGCGDRAAERREFVHHAERRIQRPSWVARQITETFPGTPVRFETLLAPGQSVVLSTRRDDVQTPRTRRRHAEYYHDLLERADVEIETLLTAEWRALYGWL